jgi:hypothetical protein
MCSCVQKSLKEISKYFHTHSLVVLWYCCNDSSPLKIYVEFSCDFVLLFVNFLRNSCMLLILKSCYGILTLGMRIYDVYASDWVLFFTVLEFDLLVSCFTSYVNISIQK